MSFREDSKLAWEDTKEALGFPYRDTRMLLSILYGVLAIAVPAICLGLFIGWLISG